MLSRSKDEIYKAASAGWEAITGIQKKGEKGRKDSSSHPRASTYAVTSPTGQKTTVTNLSEFYRRNDLNIYCMVQCASPTARAKTHKGGWTCKKIT